MAVLAANTITSTTVEDALLEIIRRVADLQNNTTTNPQARTVITQFSQNELTGVITVGLTIPSSITLTAGGVLVNATEVFI